MEGFLKGKKFLVPALISLFLFTGAISCRRQPPSYRCQTDRDCPKNYQCIGGRCQKIPPSEEKINLTIWGVFDDRGAYKAIIEGFEATHPNISITYIKKDYKDYERDLLDALAADEGPDIWFLHNDWLPKHKNKILPIPSTIYTIEEYKNTFAPVAYEDLSDRGKIYGVPLAIDNLALFYNLDLFEKARIRRPPTTWEEFIEDVKKLTKREGDQILVSGAALGTVENIPRAVDILSALMLQTGTIMVSDDRSKAYFNQYIKSEGEIVYPGTDALEFYTSFTQPLKSFYSWNESMPYALNAFLEGKVAMIFGYSWLIPIIEREKSPRFRYDTAPFPQIRGTDNPLTYANYWALVVSKKTNYPDECFEFLKFASSRKSVLSYYKATKKPPARLDLIDQARTLKYYGTFAGQVPIAKSWYKGNAEEVEEIFKEMINAVIKYGQPPQAAIDAAAREVTNILQKYL